MIPIGRITGSFVLPPSESSPELLAASRGWLFIKVILGDFFVLTGAFQLAVQTRENLPTILAKHGFVAQDHLKLIFLGAFIYLLLLEIQGGYRRAVFLAQKDALRMLLKVSLIWGALVLLGTRAFDVHNTISRLFVFWTVVYSFLFMVGWRMSLRRFLCWTQQAGLLKDRVLVVGWSKETQRLFEQTTRNVGHPFQFIGCTPSAHGRFWVNPPRSVPMLGDYNGLQSFLEERRPDTLILGDLDPAMGEITALSQLCVKEGVNFMIIPSYFQIFAASLNLESIGGVPVMGVTRLPLDNSLNRGLKRIIDIVGALVGLGLSFPLIAIFGYFVHRESPGPILYKADRMGLRGRRFKMLKIRSMRLDAGEKRAVANDDRRLKIGIFMRKWNIDEIPQFWNVLMGDMSLVGPRPEILKLAKDLKDQIQFYNARHFVKPGMTGWAQVNGWRGDTDLTERLRVDLFYQENWTLFLDFYIMARTFWSHKNAY
jgi:exopolysaccharide biosynthesis polyprenyl glycosylphosphotransferase